MHKVVITGATGMLGIALSECLLQQDYQILAIINPKSKRVNGLPKHDNICLLACDLSELDKVQNRIHDSYDIFYHFAWSGTYGNARNDMYQQSNNVKYTLDAVELAHKLGCKVFLGAGSQAEYGRVDDHIKLKPNTPVFPETGYGIAKLCAGQMSRIKCQEYGIKHVWTRILSTYGPYDGSHTMVMSGIIKFLNGEKPSYTKGEQMWDYLYCKDAARVFQLAAEKGKNGSIYCVGSGQVKPLREYIESIRNIVNPAAEIGFGEISYYDKQVMYLCADIENLTNDTGFVPQYSFEQGIKETVEWYKECSK